MGEVIIGVLMGLMEYITPFLNGACVKARDWSINRKYIVQVDRKLKLRGRYYFIGG